MGTLPFYRGTFPNFHAKSDEICNITSRSCNEKHFPKSLRFCHPKSNLFLAFMARQAAFSEALFVGCAGGLSKTVGYLLVHSRLYSRICSSWPSEFDTLSFIFHVLSTSLCVFFSFFLICSFKISVRNIGTVLVDSTRRASVLDLKNRGPVVGSSCKTSARVFRTTKNSLRLCQNDGLH